MALSTPRATRGTAIAIGSTGESKSWVTQQTNVARIFNLFVEHNDNDPANPRIGAPLEKLTEKKLCDQTMYARFARYLVHGYVKPAGTKGGGEHLGCDTAINY